MTALEPNQGGKPWFSTEQLDKALYAAFEAVFKASPVYGLLEAALSEDKSRRRADGREAPLEREWRH